MKPNRKEIIMGKKRNCRMTDEEKKMHERAIKLRKMTDAQLCEFIDHTYGKGMEEGTKLAQLQEKPGQTKGADPVKKFIEWLEGRTGSGNRIGRGTILQLNRELENAIDGGLFNQEGSI